MDAVNDPAVRELWVMKSAQVGWTEILNNVVGYFIDQDPSPMLMVQPTLEMGEAWAKDRFAPMARDTPCIREKIADPKSRDSGNTLLHKRFAGGHLTIAGANSPAGLASRPIRVVLFDEVDRYPASAGAEGDPISLGKKRTATFWNRKILAGSTPTVKGSSRVESGFEGSDQRYYMVPCTHCDTPQRLVWSQVRWHEGQPETAVYVCQHCGSALTDADKRQMLLAGEWRATKPANGIAGFHISELYSPWTTWPEMAEAFLSAKKLPETLQTWINTALGETWEDKGETLEATGLASRRESYTKAALPAGVTLLTVGTDTQDDRLEVAVWGWGADEEAWLVEYVILRGDPNGPQVWAEHDEILKRRYRTDAGLELGIEAACVDSGGHCTEAVYRYSVPRKRLRVWAIKGVGGPGRLVWPKRPGRAAKVRADVWPIGVDTIKDVIYGRLKRVTEPGPGCFHFCADADDAFFDQLASETLVHRTVQGRRIRMWKPRSSGARQEGLDTTVYAYAAFIGRGGSQVVSRRIAHDPAEPTVEQAIAPAAVPVVVQTARARTAARPRASWMNGWR